VPAFVVTTRRTASSNKPATALDAVAAEAGVTVLAKDNPNVVTIETTPEIAERLRSRLQETHFVEPEIRRGLQ
jgi:hypothetical protein